MKAFDYIRSSLRSLLHLRSDMDTAAAEQNIRGNVYFRGANILILAFSIIIASVGLNVNSTAVIIGAMLISPLMGPIIGVGLAGSINDTRLLRDSLWNLLLMVVISLAASALYFMLSPLELANPTELEARTSPSIFDVLIALFGGAAGIVELSRKEKGTVISGVAIATALMPPLCTAGYGLASWNGHFLFGALGLFGINAIFIALATYLGAKLLGYKEVQFVDSHRAKNARIWVSVFVLLVIAVSLGSAVKIVRKNNFESSAEAFVRENRSMDKAYIYDYHIDDAAHKVEIRVTGRRMSERMRAALYESAAAHGIPFDALTITENTLQETDDIIRSEQLASKVEQSEIEDARRDAMILSLSEQLDSLRARLDSLQRPENAYSFTVEPSAMERDESGVTEVQSTRSARDAG
ncbi:MAG: DUF389 domain-containing protein [Bacteroidales bacterium]|nr:DUF389 domain-containing protein [Bacteroidales bacterium]